MIALLLSGLWAQLLTSLCFLIDGVRHRARMDPCQQGAAPAAQVSAGKSLQEGGRGGHDAVFGVVPGTGQAPLPHKSPRAELGARFPTDGSACGC